MRSIINTQDEELAVRRKDERGRIGLYVRIGEDGMGHNTSRVAILRLDDVAVEELIGQLKAVRRG